MLAEAQRRHWLAAMGIEVYVLRSRHAPAPLPAVVAADALLNPQTSSAHAANDSPRLVIVCERAAPAQRELIERQQAQLLRALNLSSAQVEWLHIDGGKLEREPPSLHAWLVLGEHLARVLGEQVATPQQNDSVIAVAPALPQALHGAAGKRALWQTLKPLARHLHRAEAPTRSARH